MLDNLTKLQTSFDGASVDLQGLPHLNKYLEEMRYLMMIPECINDHNIGLWFKSKSINLLSCYGCYMLLFIGRNLYSNIFVLSDIWF